MDELFLAYGDLLEATELQCELNDYLTESSNFLNAIRGFNADKLNDKEYVDTLITSIKSQNANSKELSKKINPISSFVVALANIVNPLLPIPAKIATASICIAFIPLNNKISEKSADNSTKTWYKNILKFIDKSINALENGNKDVSPSEKKQIDKKLAELKKNKKNVEDALASMNEKKEK